MAQNKNIDWSQYKNQWVALTKNRKEIIASSAKVESTYKEASKKKKDFFIVNASAYSGSFIL